MSSNSSPASSAGAPDVTALFGPLLLGVLLNTLLYGVMLVQAYLYFHHFKTDRMWFKWLVGYLVVVETANLVCDIGLIYEPLILRYAQPQALITSPILLRADGILTVLVSTPAQLFVAWRLHVITHSYTVSLAIGFLAIVSFGGGLSVSAIVTMHPDFQSFPTFKPEVFTWFISSAACDVLLTSALVVSLWKRKSKVAATDSYVNKIIRLTVHTGMITAAAALADMLLYAFIPNTTYNFIIDFALAKLYTNSLLSTLNARPWRQDHSGFYAPNVLFEPTSQSTSSGVLSSMSGGMHMPRSRFSVTLPGNNAHAHALHGAYSSSKDGKGTMNSSYPPWQPSAPNHRGPTPTPMNVTLTTQVESFLDMAPGSYRNPTDLDSMIPEDSEMEMQALRTPSRRRINAGHGQLGGGDAAEMV
uniref:DUF6534 domain-containing protein n=1 Tax=Mycena chlorophos TaxID=658473 RepID=A0ABQ0LB78_MYCCL|nr:predicted protein [Mycena chlorophos]